jgi:hypothetical protein
LGRGSISLRELIARRLAGVLLAGSRAETAAAVVQSLGAVQSQDYGSAKWALAQRTRGVTDADVERELTSGDILRTHVLRPTWHFVRPADIRWMLALTAPRIRASMAFRDRQLELDEKMVQRSNAAIAKALSGGKTLTRPELGKVLERARVKVASGQHLGHLVMRAELDAVVCSGARQGSQSTYALLDERVPAAPPVLRDEALLELTRRYFGTRGPATLHDFAWWSGLTVADAKRGVEMTGQDLTRVTFEDDAHWFVERPLARAAAAALLLPNYDEYFIAYKDRGAVGRRLGNIAALTGGDARITHVIFVNGELVGRWRRTTQRKAVVVELMLETTLEPAEQARLRAATVALREFLATPVTIVDTAAV